MLSVDTLERANELIDQQVPIATIVKVLGLHNKIHYRTAYDLIKADNSGYHSATRPNWLEDEPAIQVAPEGWWLHNGLTEQGEWHKQTTKQHAS